MAANSEADGSPIFFYKEHEKDFGFMSNFHYKPFTAPNPASWLPQLAATSDTPTPTGAEEPQQETIEFRHSEQYYMYCKALYFGDKDTAWMILKAKSPTDVKALGRAVTPFSDGMWMKDDVNVRAMEEGLWWKFGGGQLSRLLEGPEKHSLMAAKEKKLEVIGDRGRRLLATGERQLIEAAGRDRFWGIGYSVKQGPNFYKKNWGRNQLGKSLMVTRKRLADLVGV